jgi:hypothetical protein
LPVLLREKGERTGEILRGRGRKKALYALKKTWFFLFIKRESSPTFLLSKVRHYPEEHRKIPLRSRDPLKDPGVKLIVR